MSDTKKQPKSRPQVRKLSREELENVVGGATLDPLVPIPGCCTQGCCPDVIGPIPLFP